jgi:hypothetical protein
VDNNYLDLGMNKSGFVHTLPSGRLSLDNTRVKSCLLPLLKTSYGVLFIGLDPHG